MSSEETKIQPAASPPDPSAAHKYNLRVQNIAEMVKQKQCILFLGSAIHVASTNPKYFYPKSKCPPVGNQLSELLADKGKYPDPDRTNLQRVASHYQWATGFRISLVKAIRNAIQVEATEGDPKEGQPVAREPSPVLRALARLEFPIVITTNYDQLYERALTQIAQEKAREAKKPEAEIAATKAIIEKSVYSPRNSVKTKDCRATPSSVRPYLLKIHGDLDHDDSIVVTDEDYIQFVLRMSDKHPYHPVGKNTLTYLTKWPTLFIGYRLNDYNLRLLIKTLRWRMDPAHIPPSYAVDVKPDVLIRDAMEKQQYVSFIEKNLWDFVPDLYKEVTGQEMPA